MSGGRQVQSQRGRGRGAAAATATTATRSCATQAGKKEKKKDQENKIVPRETDGRGKKKVDEGIEPSSPEEIANQNPM